MDQRREVLHGAGSAQTLPLAEVHPSDAVVAPEDEWRKVTARGRFLPDHQVIVQGRMDAGGGSTHVVSPFVVEEIFDDDDNPTPPTILINRGPLDEDSASDADDLSTASIPAPPPGTVEITAHLRQAEQASRYAPARSESGSVVVSAIDPAQLSDATGLALAPFYLQLTADQPGALGELPLPSGESSSPHFSYGVQWLALAAAAPLALGALARSDVRRERDPLTQRI